MATSKFLRTFRTVQGVPITTAAIWLVPQANTYPTGALALTAHSTRDGQYYRDNVPDGEYKIYIDPAGGSSPTLYEEEIWIGDARITTISDHFDSADSYKLKGSGIKIDNSTIETSSNILRLKDAGVVAAKLATDAVETAKIKDANVTAQKLSFEAGKVGNNVIDNPNALDPTIPVNLSFENVTGSIVDDASFYYGKAFKGVMTLNAHAKLKYNYSEAQLNALVPNIKTGDKIKFGCWVRSNASRSAYIWNVSASGSSVLMTTTPQWIESALISYAGGALQFQIVGTSMLTSEEIYASGITMKKVNASGSDWVGYEDNNIWNAKNLFTMEVSWPDLPFTSKTLGANLIDNYDFRETDAPGIAKVFNIPTSSLGTLVSLGVVDVAQIANTRITKALKYVITPNGSFDARYKLQTSVLSSAVLATKKSPLKEGEKVTIGCYIKAINFNGTGYFYMGYNLNGVFTPTSTSQYSYAGTFVDDQWYWFEWELVVGNDDPFNFQILPTATNVVSGDVEFYITGVTVKASGPAGLDWTGYEENEEYNRDYKILSEITDSTVEAIDASLAAVGGVIEKNSYGSKIQNFLYKISSRKDTTTPYEDVKVVFIGDSITAGWSGWAGMLRTHLKAYFDLADAEFENYSHGGRDWGFLLRSIYAWAVFNNPDLIILSEYEGTSSARDSILNMKRFEQILKLLRSTTSAEIIIATRSEYEANLQWDTIDVLDPDTGMTPAMQDYNFMREMAALYNCEVIDFHAMFVRLGIAKKIELADETTYETYIGTLFADGVHPSATGYGLMSVEAIKHFNNRYWFERFNNANPNHDIEEIVELERAFVFRYSDYPELRFANKANWSLDFNTTTKVNLYDLISSSNAEYIEFDFYGVGIEIFCTHKSASAANHNVLIDTVAPSTIRTGHGSDLICLEYATEIIDESQAYAAFYSSPKSAFILEPILTGLDSNREIKLEIIITAVTYSGDTKTVFQYQLRNYGTPATVYDLVGGGSTADGLNTAGNTFDVEGGEVFIPYYTMGLEPNFDDVIAGSHFAVNDTFQFSVKKNWIDSFDSNAGSSTTDEVVKSARIFGLENKKHTIRITKTNTVQSGFDYFKIIRPLLNRKYS